MEANASTATAVAPSRGMLFCPTTFFGGLEAIHPLFHAHLHSVYDHDGVIHQHAQGDDQGTRGKSAPE